MIRGTLSRKTTKETQQNCLKFQAVPVLLHGSETCIMRKRDENKVESEGKTPLQLLKENTRQDQIQNQETGQELQM